MFKPKFVKQGLLLQKGVKKFLHYKEDIIPEPALENIRVQSEAFDAALKARDKDAVKVEADKLTKVCQKSVPNYRNSHIQENIEVIFVAIVIAVGIRAYFLQPFKIPTGSMQPTLNGIIGYDMTGDQNYESPGFLGKFWEKVTRGRTYLDVVLKEDGVLTGVEEVTVAKFFTYTDLHFKNPAQDIRLKAPIGKLPELGFQRRLNVPLGSLNNKDWVLSRPTPLKAGSVIARGYVDTGDQVLVNKFSYHFRQPKRGEVFVFNTRGIEQITPRNSLEPSQHYIKRLAGVPGDRLEVYPNDLRINGKTAEEPGFQRVMTDPAYAPGYGEMPGRAVELSATPGRKEYFAMGDNSMHSSDSRMWGTVPEENVVGPALLVYWPFIPHWGLID